MLTDTNQYEPTVANTYPDQERTTSDDRACIKLPRSRWRQADQECQWTWFGVENDLVPDVFIRGADSCCQYKLSDAPNSYLGQKLSRVIQGGAGCGKSKLINDISSHAHKILMTDDNRNIEHPLVIKLAPTGKAASIIGGLTYHSAFDLKFGNEHTQLWNSCTITRNQVWCCHAHST